MWGLDKVVEGNCSPVCVLQTGDTSEPVQIGAAAAAGKNSHLNHMRLESVSSDRGVELLAVLSQISQRSACHTCSYTLGEWVG